VSNSSEIASRALIIDQRAVLGTTLCRTLARQHCLVDVFAERKSPAFLSRFCHRALCSPQFEDQEDFLLALQLAVNETAYDEIYLCNEDVLALVSEFAGLDRWKGLLLPDRRFIKILLSKNLTLSFVQAAGVAVPRTLSCDGEDDLLRHAQALGFPLVVKGEKGESARNVRIVSNLWDLLSKYREIREREAAYGGKPVLQEFIPGSSYSVGGLYHEGKALRICAHRRLLTYPPDGGVTVKGVTERDPALLEQATAVFEALQYSGLGHVEFIRDSRDGKLKFLELNPRIWGSIAILEHAGCDVFSAYRRLVRNLPVKPDLDYREGVYFHRFSKEMRLIRKRPLRMAGFLKDAFDPRIRSDFEWSDAAPHLRIPLIREIRRYFSRQKPWSLIADPN
jgi:predicted ATP-grasp superfamily ATP-dependent carboligase